MNELTEELVRNANGYVLILIAIGLIAAGTHGHVPKLVDMGEALVDCALLAFQTKQAPAGNTRTLQVTTPETDKP